MRECIRDLSKNVVLSDYTLLTFGMPNRNCAVWVEDGLGKAIHISTNSSTPSLGVNDPGHKTDSLLSRWLKYSEHIRMGESKQQ